MHDCAIDTPRVTKSSDSVGSASQKQSAETTESPLVTSLREHLEKWYKNADKNNTRVSFMREQIG